MPKKASKSWPEFIISKGDKNYTQAIRRAAKAGVLRKIAPKIYTSNLKDSPENIIKRHRYQILDRLFPTAVISYRSAFDGGISPDGNIILTYKYTKTVKIPGMTIRLFKGPGPDSDDTPFMENLFISSRARTFLENITPSRTRKGFIKAVPQLAIEEKLDSIARIYGTKELNDLRDAARKVAARLKMKEEFKILDKMIGALLGTKNDFEQQSERGRARARGEPYDAQRVELFAILASYLQQQNLPIYKNKVLSTQARINQAFFEAYFSNYIEGTEFEITEAEQIIFENKIFSNRPEDSHDILGTFQIVSDQKLMKVIPETAQQLILILKQRHSLLMGSRKDKMPGQFKTLINRVGNTVFVKPDEVVGTFIKGFEFYQRLPVGIPRAIFMMFLIAEVHPFVDGNGRIARILMNAELEAANQSRILIPTIYREDYLLALRKLSRKFDPAAYVKMLTIAQQFTTAFSYEDYQQTLFQFQACNAFLEPNEGKLIIP